MTDEILDQTVLWSKKTSGGLNIIWKTVTILVITEVFVLLAIKYKTVWNKASVTHKSMPWGNDFLHCFNQWEGWHGAV